MERRLNNTVRKATLVMFAALMTLAVGYLLLVTEDSGLPPILEAIVDAAKSTIDSEALDVQFDDKSVAVNFQGLDYDDATFVKVDLVFDEAF